MGNSISNVIGGYHSSPIYVRNPAGVNIDVLLGDQVSPSLDLYFTYPINTTSLDGAISKYQYNNITLAAGHGAVVGNQISIIGSGGLVVTTGQVTAVASNDVTIDIPSSNDFDDGAIVLLSERNLGAAVYGSGSQASPSIYRFLNPISPGVDIDVTRLMWQMVCATGVDLSLFGDLAALTNGMVLRKIESDGTVINYFSIKDNSEISLHAYDMQIYASTNPASGIDGLAARMTWASQGKRGVAIRLAPGDQLQAVIQDDLTGLTTFYLQLQGHVVVD